MFKILHLGTVAGNIARPLTEVAVAAPRMWGPV